MRAAAAFSSHAKLSGRQVDVVADDQNVVFLHLLMLHPVFHGLATQVHIGGGHHQDERAALVFPLRHVGMTVGAKSDRQFLRQSINYLKTNIMTSASILVFSVPQPEYDEFSAIFHYTKFELAKIHLFSDYSNR